MKDWRAFWKKWENCIEALVFTALLFAVTALRFDFYYELNDDVLIKDILSGVYSGSPEGHTMQLLYPLGFLLSLCYRLLSVPVFGVFLVLCQYGSIYVIAYRALGCCRTWPGRLLILAAVGSFFEAVFGRHLVFLQYTVTAGMLAAAAIFWFLTIREEAAPDRSATQGAAVFVRKNSPVFVLYWIAFCLRSEMALLLLPLAGVAGLCRWGWERRIFTKENVTKYLAVFGILVLGMAALLGLDSLAYTGEDWRSFRSFFAERTELYDYQFDFVMHYEENAVSYEAAGVSGTRQKLLENYNFGVDDSMDAAFLGTLRESAVNRQQAGGVFPVSAAEALWSLRHRWTGRQDYPVNVCLWIGAVLLIFMGIPRGNRRLFWQVPLCLATGAALWMFLLLRNRPVDRVLHPLYLGQIAVFAGILLLAVRQNQHNRAVWQDVWQKEIAALGALLVLAVTIIRVPGVFSQIESEIAQREQNNAVQEAVLAYCEANPQILYLEDVYSTVTYNEKISVDRDKPFNYDLLGGWLVKSPLTAKKLVAFGYETMGKAGRAGKNVQLLTEAGTDFTWLAEYFAEEGFEADILKTGTIADRVEIYQVVPKMQEAGAKWRPKE